MKLVTLKKIKQNKGFTTADIIIAIAIIMVFVGTMTTVFYNYYITTTSRNRNAMATNCIIDIIEKIKQMDYANVDAATIDLEVEKMKKNGIIPNGYKPKVTVQSYNKMPGNTGKQDVIKILTVKLEYVVGNKNEKLEISTLVEKRK